MSEEDRDYIAATVFVMAVVFTVIAIGKLFKEWVDIWRYAIHEMEQP